MPIDENLDSGTIIPRTAKAPHAHITVVAIITDIKAPDASQDIREGTIAIFFNLFSSHNAYRGGSTGDLLFIF
jgi:hypothetical protein